MFRFFVLTILFTFVVLSNVEAHDTSCYYLHYNGRVSDSNPNGHRFLTGSALRSAIANDSDLPDSYTISGDMVQIDNPGGSYKHPPSSDAVPYVHRHYHYIDRGGGDIARYRGSWIKIPELTCEDESTYPSDTPAEFLPGGSSNPHDSDTGTTDIGMDIDVKVNESDREIEITITFNEAISDFNGAAITVRINGNTSPEQFSGSGTTYTLTTTYTGTNPPAVSVQIDPEVTSEGNADGSTMSIIPNSSSGDVSVSQSTTDVDGNGRTDTKDLLKVAQNFGSSNPQGSDNEVYDIDGDGDVDLDDFRHIMSQLQGENAAAPAASLALQLERVKALHSADPDFQRAMQLFEEQLIKEGWVELVPEKTVLLANYPNPFNPETWIPYRLAESADVTLTIYAANGKVVRTLALGHQRAGNYLNRARAAYWDGKNAFGESVASGVYFYSLTADDFSATRKMLIAK